MANEKNPIISAILSLVIPGLGQVYNGTWKKGVVIFVVACIAYYLFTLLGVVVSLFAIYDAYMEAKGKPVWKFA